MCIHRKSPLVQESRGYGDLMKMTGRQRMKGGPQSQGEAVVEMVEGEKSVGARGRWKGKGKLQRVSKERKNDEQEHLTGGGLLADAHSACVCARTLTGERRCCTWRCVLLPDASRAQRPRWAAPRRRPRRRCTDRRRCGGNWWNSPSGGRARPEHWGDASTMREQGDRGEWRMKPPKKQKNISRLFVNKEVYSECVGNAQIYDLKKD